MKKFIVFLLITFTCSGCLNAQDTTRSKKPVQIQKRDRIHQEEHIIFWDGKTVSHAVNRKGSNPKSIQNKKWNDCLP